MSREKRNRILVVLIVIFLLLIVGSAFYFHYKKSKEDKQQGDVLKFHQLYSSTYDLISFNDLYFGIYENKMVAVIDSNGKEIYNANQDIYYTGVYLLEKDKYLIYGIKDDVINTYIYENNTIIDSKEYKMTEKVQPLLYRTNDEIYILGFVFYSDNEVSYLNLKNNELISFGSVIFVGDVLTDYEVFTNNDNYIVVKNLAGNFGVFRLNGEEVVALNFDDATTTKQDVFIVKNNDTYMMINSKMEKVIKNSYPIISLQTDKVLVVNKQNKCAVYDLEGNMLVDFVMRYHDQILYNSKSLQNNMMLYSGDKNLFFGNNVLGNEQGDFYFIKNNKIVNSVKEDVYHVGESIVIVDGDKVVFFDEDGEERFSFTVEDSNINSIRVEGDYCILGLDDDFYLYSIRGEKIGKIDEPIVSFSDNYLLTESEEGLNLYNMSLKQVSSIKGETYKVNDNIVTLDYAIYVIK